MESLAGLKSMLPSTVISGDLSQVTLRISVRDVAEAIARQIRQSGVEVRYEVQGDVIVFTIALSPSRAR